MRCAPEAAFWCVTRRRRFIMKQVTLDYGTKNLILVGNVDLSQWGFVFHVA